MATLGIIHAPWVKSVWAFRPGKAKPVGLATETSWNFEISLVVSSVVIHVLVNVGLRLSCAHATKSGGFRVEAQL